MAIPLKELAQTPLYKGISEGDLFDYLSTKIYPDIPRRELAQRLGYTDPQDKRGLITNTLTQLGQGVLQIPSMVVGAADILASQRPTKPDRPMAKLAEEISQATGINPSKLAEEANAQLSPEAQAQIANQNAIWANPEAGALDVAKGYIQNPQAAIAPLVQSLPLTLAGGLIAKGLLRTGAVSSPVVASTIGEGGLSAGAGMAQTDKSVNPEIAAQYALLTGLGVGAVAGGSAAAAKALGIIDPDILLAGGVTGATVAGRATPTLAKRVIGGIVQEGLIEEGAQGVIESALQNAAEGKPLDTGMARNVVEGVLAGSALGAMANLAGSQSTDEAIDSASAAATAPPPRSPLTPPGGIGGPSVTPGFTPTNTTDQPAAVDAAIADSVAKVMQPPSIQTPALQGELVGDELSRQIPIAESLTVDPITGQVIQPLLTNQLGAPSNGTNQQTNTPAIEEIKRLEHTKTEPTIGSNGERTAFDTSGAGTPTGTDKGIGGAEPFTHEDRATTEQYRHLGGDRYQDADGNIWNFTPGELLPITQPSSALAAPQPTENINGEVKSPSESTSNAREETQTLLTQPSAVQEPAPVTPSAGSIPASMKVQRDWLLNQTDKALLNAPNTPRTVLLENYEIKSLEDSRKELLNAYNRNPSIQLQNSIEDLNKQIHEAYAGQKDRLIFNVPGGGTYKVENNQTALQEFRNKVSKQFVSSNKGPRVEGATTANTSRSNVIANFLKDGEFDNAYFAAQELNHPLGYTELNGKVYPLSDIEKVDLIPGRETFVGRRIGDKGQNIWQVIDEPTGAFISIEKSKQSAIKNAKEKLAKFDIRKLKDIEKLPGTKTQNKLLEQFKKENNIIDATDEIPPPPPASKENPIEEIPPTPPVSKEQPITERSVMSPYLNDKKFMLFMSDFEVTINDMKNNAKDAFDYIQKTISEYDAFINCVRG